MVSFAKTRRVDHLAYPHLVCADTLLDYSERISIILIAAAATGVPGPKMAAAPS